jgi:hypothetical protein
MMSSNGRLRRVPRVPQFVLKDRPVDSDLTGADRLSARSVGGSLLLVSGSLLLVSPAGLRRAGSTRGGRSRIVQSRLRRAPQNFR